MIDMENLKISPKVSVKKENKQMSKIMSVVINEDSVLVFDVDGVLAPYEYGEYNHNACRDDVYEEYMKTHNIYDGLRPLKTIQNVLEEHNNPKRVFTCSVAAPYEVEAKKSFVLKNYDIPEENIIFVESKKEKLSVLHKIHDEYFPDLDPKMVVMIEDTTATLTQIQENSEFSTMHVSSLLD